MSKVIGADKVMRGMARLRVILPKKMAEATRKNGEDVIRVARAAHVGDGENRAAIQGSPQGEGGYLLDFGPKSKVTEGRKAEKPFVNPALDATRKRRKNRTAYASRKAVKEAFGD